MNYEELLASHMELVSDYKIMMERFEMVESELKTIKSTLWPEKPAGKDEK